MISRRTILAWLGLAPVAIAVAKTSAGDVVAAAPRVRSRTWKHVLEPDGSSSFVKNGERWLDSWVKTQSEKDWDPGGRVDYVFPDGRVERGTAKTSLNEIKGIIDDDVESIQTRIDPEWPNKVVEAEEMELRIRRKSLGFPPEYRVTRV